LLFNEADAIIGKRQVLDGNAGGARKTENAIQNIILQEIENLDGILIATTNLSQNMDKAFERRFLYKIEFEKPAVETRAQIWKEMFPYLTDIETMQLAKQFEFSGGQIENVLRRSTVKEILSGMRNTIDTLIKICQNEKIEVESKRIGFM
jgi:SpoVK/Ycf46/Vps4 family AAA+-type ATPase